LALALAASSERVLRDHDAVLAPQLASLRRVANLVTGGAASSDIFAAIAREVAEVAQRVEQRHRGVDLQPLRAAVHIKRYGNIAWGSGGSTHNGLHSVITRRVSPQPGAASTRIAIRVIANADRRRTPVVDCGVRGCRPVPAEPRSARLVCITAAFRQPSTVAGPQDGCCNASTIGAISSSSSAADASRIVGRMPFWRTISTPARAPTSSSARRRGSASPRSRRRSVS